jgi:hypothetical protein
LYGQWGTAAQCAGDLITPHGTRRAAPFEIRNDWLNHAEVWCRLNWISSVASTTGFFAVARGLCGEDDVRDYQIRFDFSIDQLTISWNELIVNGPLQRCISEPEA